MATVLYDLLGTGAETGGTWTDVSPSSPSPAAPGSYDGSIDLSSYAAGVYAYTYTVSGTDVEDPKTVTINWLGMAPSRTNVTCAGAQLISGTFVLPFDVFVNDDNRTSCGQASITQDGSDAFPSPWDETLLSGNLYYLIEAPSRVEGYEIVLKVDSSAKVNPATNLHIQVWMADAGDVCGDKVETIYASSPGTFVSTAVFIPGGGAKRIWFRVLSGKFTTGEFSVSAAASASIIVVEDGGEAKDFYSQSFAGVSDGIIVWTQATGTLPADDRLDADLNVFVNGNRIEYDEEFTITRDTGPGQSTITHLFPFAGANYVVVAFLPTP